MAVAKEFVVTLAVLHSELRADEGHIGLNAGLPGMSFHGEGVGSQCRGGDVGSDMGLCGVVATEGAVCAAAVKLHEGSRGETQTVLDELPVVVAATSEG